MGIISMIFCFIMLYYRRKLKELKMIDLAQRSGHINKCAEKDEEATNAPSKNSNYTIKPSSDAAQNPLYLNNVKVEKETNINVFDTVKTSPNFQLYQEANELQNNLREMLAKGPTTNNEENDDYDSYDHLNYQRTVNDVSPNYFKLNNI